MKLQTIYAAILRHNPFSKFAIYFFIVIGTVFLLSPPDLYPKWFFPRLTGIGALFCATVLIALAAFFRINPESDLATLNRKHRALRRLQTYTALVFILGITGTLGLYQLEIPYDKFLHLFQPFFITIALSRFLYRWKEMPLDRAIAITMVVVLLLSAGWELLEFTSDQIFGTQALGLRGKEIFTDTIFNASLDLLGTLMGVAAVYLRKKPWPY